MQPKREESHQELYEGTFQAITRDWKRHKNSIGTQKLLLDIALSRVNFQSIYPLYIADEFLKLLGNIFEGKKSSHVEDAVRQLSSRSSHITLMMFFGLGVGGNHLSAGSCLNCQGRSLPFDLEPFIVPHELTADVVGDFPGCRSIELEIDSDAAQRLVPKTDV